MVSELIDSLVEQAARLLSFFLPVTLFTCDAFSSKTLASRSCYGDGCFES